MNQNKKFHKTRKTFLYSTANIDHQNILSILDECNKFETDIDKKISQFRNQGINVSACPEYFETLIDEHIAKLHSKLEKEHTGNMQLIASLFRKRAADKIELHNLLERIEEELAETDAEYKALQKIAATMNPLKNGRLTAEQTSAAQEEDINE